MIERHYEEELRQLYESGREFARAHPVQAGFLNIDAVGDRDPGVERLFEGFAFLTARVREKLDDSFPELTSGVLQMLWPQILQEIPAVTIVQLKPRAGMLQETRTLPQGSEIISGPIGSEATVCRFTTTRDAPLNPLTLTGIDRTTDSRGRASLSLRFQIENGCEWRKLALDRIRIFISADLPLAAMVHEFFTTRVISTSLTTGNGQVVTAGERALICAPAGLASTEPLLPSAPHALRGYSLLLEYLACPWKFLFFDLCGCEAVAQCDPAPQTLICTFTFDGDFPVGVTFGADLFRLHCVPAINLFVRSIELPGDNDYRLPTELVADSTHPAGVHCQSIVAVESIDRITGERRAIEPTFTFGNITGHGKRTYAALYERGQHGRRELFLQINSGALSSGGAQQQETMTITARCHNGALPHDAIGEGDLSRGGRDFPDYVGVSNIIRPTRPATPPPDDSYHWNVFSHLSSTGSLPATTAGLKALLRFYHWTGDERYARRIDAIDSVQTSIVEAAGSGGAQRGLRFTVAVQTAMFNACGDEALFGTILLEFLSHFVTVSSFTELVIVCKPSGRNLKYKPVQGKRCLI
jgi:type VI secretion system protein ImpG